MTYSGSAVAAVTATLSLDYLSYTEVAAQPSSWWRNVLGVAGFNAVPRFDMSTAPLTASMTPALTVNDSICEVWRVSGNDSQLSGGPTRNGIRYRFCDELLFGCISIDEHTLDGAAGAAQKLLTATENAYQGIFDLLTVTGHRHLIRIWNYLPDINGSADGNERYRHFNSARQTAFRKSGRATMGTVPAASALGSPTGSPISIYFLASTRPPVMIENPRQTSAYHYPPQFGRHSPIFSRACVWGEPTYANLFISGTASIVGHESLHPGDVVAQTRETLVNIGALLNETNRVVGSPRYSLEALKLKVYVRRPHDFEAIRNVLTDTVGASTGIVYLLADVCRDDLLVEIEATGEAAR